MTAGLSPRLAAIVAALPLTPRARVLEIGCGPGAAARAVAKRLETGHILAIDRSAKAIDQARTLSVAELASGRMSLRHIPAESFVREPGEAPFDIAFAIRVGALDGRQPAVGQQVMKRLRTALAPGGRVFVDGGSPLRELSLPTL